MGNDKFFSCGSCGTTFSSGSGICPNCGAMAENHKKSYEDMVFAVNKTIILNIVKIIIVAVVVAVAFFFRAAAIQHRAGEYSEEIQKLEASIGAAEDYSSIHKDTVRLSKYQRSLNVVNVSTVVYVIASVMHVAAAFLVALRFRLSFKFLMVVGVISAVAAVVLHIVQSFALIDGHFNIYVILIDINVAFAVAKLSYDMDLLINGVSSNKPNSSALGEKSAPAVVGAAMPKAQEVYSFEDMFGSAGNTVPQPLTAVPQPVTEAPKPIDKIPQMAQVKTDIGATVNEKGENVAVTALAPAAAAVIEKSEDSMLSIDRQEEQAAPEDEDKLWFCPMCGSINEFVNVCNFCGHIR